MSEKITFVASLPDIQSAVSIGGGEMDSSRIKLDVPGTDTSAVLRLLLLRGKAFRVTVEELETED